MFGLCCRFLLRLAARLTAALVEAVEGLLWPHACAMCGAACAGAPGAQEGLCGPCGEAVERLARGPRCLRCDALLVEGAHPRHGCRACRGRPLEVSRVAALGPHEGGLRRAVLRLKSGGRASGAATLGRLLARRIEALGLAADVDVVVAVPPSLRADGTPTRALDHAALIASSLAATLGRPFAAGALERREPSATSQKSLVRRDRWLQAKDAYRPAGEASPALGGRRVLLVDDVMTSGATIAACAAACRAAGADRILAACVTRQARREPKSTIHNARVASLGLVASGGVSLAASAPGPPPLAILAGHDDPLAMLRRSL